MCIVLVLDMDKVFLTYAFTFESKLGILFLNLCMEPGLSLEKGQGFCELGHDPTVVFHFPLDRDLELSHFLLHRLVLDGHELLGGFEVGRSRIDVVRELVQPCIHCTLLSLG
jgi:hypothetical protein